MRWLFVSALLGVGCGFDFADPGVVIGRRILSIEVDPPQLTQGTRHVEVSALVVEPDLLNPPVPFSWSFCAMLPTVGGGAAAAGGFGAASATRCDDAGFVLSSGMAHLDQLSLDVPIPPELPSAARLQIELVVGGDAGLYGVKRVSPPVSSMLMDAPNTNPIISSVLMDGLTWDEDGGMSLVAGACVNGQTQTVSTGRRMTSTICSHRVEAVIADDQHQLYTSIDALGNQMPERERLRFAYFTDDGVMERDTTTEPSATSVMPVSGDGGVSSRWDEPSPAKNIASTVWIVVRDGRGGESFVARRVFWQR